MTTTTTLPRTELMPNLAFRMMNLHWKITDVFSSPAKKLNHFNIQPGWTVIDYGCGPGRYLKRASQMVGPEGKVFAVDVHELAIRCAMKKKAKNQLKNLEVVQAIEYFAPIQENTANMILVLDVFHMISNPKLFLEELHRLVKPGGKLILEDGHQSRKKTRKKVDNSIRWRVVEETRKHLVCEPLWKSAQLTS